MSIMGIFIAIIIICVVFYLLRKYVAGFTIDGIPVGWIIVIIFVVIVCLWLLSLAGIISGGTIHLG